MSSVFDHMDITSDGKGSFHYVMTSTLKYFSPRYRRWVIANKGDRFDGATGAIDIDSKAWIIHDVLCRDGRFADGTKCTNWMASHILKDILKDEGRWFRARTWFVATWLFGGGKARENGMW